MKFLFAFLILIACQTAFACPNFSGQFKTSSNITYKIAQGNCDTMDIVDDGGTFTVVFSGVEQLIYDFDLLKGNEVIGRHKVYITSKIENEKWVYDEKAISLYADGTKEIKLSWSEVFLNTDLDLVTIFHRSNGAIETYVDKRITHQKTSNHQMKEKAPSLIR